MPKPAILGGRPAFKKNIPFAHPGFFPSPAFLKKISRTLEEGILSKGPWVERFEERCAAYLGVKHAMAVSSCLNGLLLAFHALDLKGEVIVPSFTFPAPVGSVVRAGLQPVFADCDPDSLNMDPAHVERLITKKTAGLLAVSNYGLPPDISRLNEIATRYKIPLLFDSAQGFGAIYQGKRMGGFGVVEIFSFSQSKILTTGEGGLVATNDAALAEKVRQGRNYGKGNSEAFLFSGLSARMSEVNALIGLELLARVSKFLKRRKRLADLYRKNLGRIQGLRFQKAEEGLISSENFFPVFIESGGGGLNRDLLSLALARENIETRKFFFPPAHRHPAFQKYAKSALPETDRAAEECLALPLHPNLGTEDVERVCQAVERISRYSGKVGEIPPHIVS